MRSVVKGCYLHRPLDLGVTLQGLIQASDSWLRDVLGKFSNRSIVEAMAGPLKSLVERLSRPQEGQQTLPEDTPPLFIE